MAEEARGVKARRAPRTKSGRAIRDKGEKEASVRLMDFKLGCKYSKSKFIFQMVHQNS
jgi:hypothetical protein